MSQSSSGTEISYSWSSDKNKLPSVLSILFRVLSDSKIFILEVHRPKTQPAEAPDIQ